mmetsp:Transcript_41605/g.63495  ORF Transcript_41605/g.63495 Transcript_41605/m.63495 type:complete len:90 (+) Transcript_41605:2002-2271(+)
MFGEDGGEGDEETVDKEATYKKYCELASDYQRCRAKSKNEYDFFNLVERSILGMEEDEVPCQGTEAKKAISDEEFRENGLSREEMHQIV